MTCWGRSTERFGRCAHIALYAVLCLASWLSAAPGPGAGAPPAAATPTSALQDPSQYWLDLAQVHQRYDMAEEAEKCYAAAFSVAKSSPSRVQVLSAWGEWLARRGDVNGGQAKLEQALTLVEDKRTRCRVALSLARALEQGGKLDEAGKQYESVMVTAEDPWQRDAAQSQLFAAHQRAGTLDVVIKRYEDALAANPKDETALRALHAVYARFKPDAAADLAITTRLVEVNPKDTQLLQQLAEMHLRARDADKAAALYARLIEAEPAQRSRYIERICNAFLAADQKDKAVEWAQRLAEGESHNPQSWVRYADVCLRAGENAKALAAFDKALATAPSEAEKDMLRLRMAEALRTTNQPEQALAIYRDLAERSKLSNVAGRARRMVQEMTESREPPAK